MSSVEPIHGHVSEHEAKAAVTAQLRWVVRFSAAVFALFTALVLYVFMASGQPWQTAYYLGIPPLALLTYALVYRPYAERAHRACVETHYVVGEEGFEVRNPQGTVHASWRSFDSFAEHDKMFVFYTNGTVSSVLAKRPFKPVDVQRIRSLLEAGIVAH
jgi:hypothetical protein